MIKTVQQINVAQIFSIESDRVYRIPKYQREYTWGVKEWDALFYDICENDFGYFLGSYICVTGSALSETVLEIVDGQQRFTSITLLFAALYKKLSELKDYIDDDDYHCLANLRCELANKKTNEAGKKEYLQRLFLQKQNQNDEDYAFVLSDAGVLTLKKNKPANFGNRRISKAFKHFYKLIEEELLKDKREYPNSSGVNHLLDILKKIERAVLVGIEVDTNKDAYMLFESLNHRGVPLSALDLIKNTLIAEAELRSDADATYELWKQILADVGQDDYATQERFFRQYYNAFRDELNRPYASHGKRYFLGLLATRTTLLDIYEKMVRYDYSALLADLSEKAQKYSIIVNNSENEYLYTIALQNLERISGAPSYILLLYILSNQNDLALNDENVKSVVEILITFFVRRNLTDVPNTRKLTQLFIDIIDDIKDKRGSEVVLRICSLLKDVSASNELFEEKLRGPIYDENPEAARFVLCSIEAMYQTREIYSNLWSRDSSNKYIWTIEHIFPEGENIPSSWVDMIADGDVNEAKKYRDEYVHTIGNLTLTGYNQNLSNMSFLQKRDRMSKDKTKQIGYRNGLFLNQDVVSEEKWSVGAINNRTNKLVAMLLKMFDW